MKMTDERLLGTIFVKAAAILRDTLLEYWPCEGGADSPEATTLLAVAHAFREQGFRTYAEVQVAGSRSEHIDLFAFSKEAGIAIAVEGKRLFRHDGVGSIHDDWNRLDSVKLASEYGKLPIGLRPFIAVVATTWDNSITSWWSELNPRGRGPAWKRLAEALQGAHRDQVQIQEDRQWGWGIQHFLCAFQARESPFTP